MCVCVCLFHRYEPVGPRNGCWRGIAEKCCEDHLADQCEIPPHIAQYLFEIVSHRGGIAPICLVSSCGIAQVSLRYPFSWGGYRTSTSPEPVGPRNGCWRGIPEKLCEDCRGQCREQEECREECAGSSAVLLRKTSNGTASSTLPGLLLFPALSPAILALSGPVLRDTPRRSAIPPYRALWGFLMSQHGQLGAIPPPPFLSVSALESMRVWRCDTPPPEKGYLSDTCAIPHEETRQMGAIPPVRNYLEKVLRDMGGYLALGR